MRLRQVYRKDRCLPVYATGHGGIHLLNGLYNAKYDGQPVLAITGNTYYDLINTFGQQDIPLAQIFSDVALYSVRVTGPDHIETATNIAIHTALGMRGVSHLNIPADTQDMTLAEDKQSMHDVSPFHTSFAFATGAQQPTHEALRNAAEVLNRGKKIAILADRGVLGGSKNLEAAAYKLGAPVIKALLGKACLCDTSPYTTGGIGFVGTKPSEEAMKECGTLLIVGSSFPYMEYYPKPGQARAVQIDISPARIGMRYQVEVAVAGDARASLQMLLPLIEQHKDRSILEKAQNGMKEWWGLMEEQGNSRSMPMVPEVVA